VAPGTAAQDAGARGTLINATMPCTPQPAQ
jgi:hypothetical protein